MTSQNLPLGWVWWRRRQFQHLSLEDFVMFAVPDATWAQYGQDGDRERVARVHPAFCATFMPALASALDCSGAVRAFGDR
jgi:hypothetical protein